MRIGLLTSCEIARLRAALRLRMLRLLSLGLICP